MHELVSAELVEKRILMIRGKRVLFDVDLADLYGVSTKRLNEQVKRNLDRFPEDFMFQLSTREVSSLVRSQNATASKRNIRYRPYVFTEHGAVMLASVLSSAIAVKMSVAIVRAFIRLRQLLSTHTELAQKIEELEGKCDGQFQVVFEAIRKLMEGESKIKPTRVKGFIR